MMDNTTGSPGYVNNDDPRYIIDIRKPEWVKQIVNMRGMEHLLFEMISLVEGTYPPAEYLNTLQANLQYALDIYTGRHNMADEIMGMVQTCVKQIRNQEKEEKNRWLGNTESLEADE